MLKFGWFGRISRRMRRTLAAAGVALLLGFQVFADVYIASEADHDCGGEGCPVCYQIQQCVANLQLTGSGLEFDAPAASVPEIAADTVVPAEVTLPSRTLVDLKVRMDE